MKVFYELHSVSGICPAPVVDSRVNAEKRSAIADKISIDGNCRNQPLSFAIKVLPVFPVLDLLSDTIDLFLNHGKMQWLFAL
ncbi:MAG: hypothetical protein ABIK68_23450, partial [bacterium]